MSKMISVASGFQYSVNIGYDLNNDDKLKNFIPTKSALMLLKDILSSTALDATERARVLVGAYGKGKSHIILTILSVLMQRDRSLFTHLMPKINEDPELKQLVDNYYSDKKNRILPVIINGTSGSLPQAFLLALQRTLDENGLDIMPETNYRAAINAIQKWKADYPKTYDKFKKEISLPVDAFISELNDYNAAIYSEFEEVYPKLTSGSIFNPFVGFDVVELYESVVKSLKQRGYLGIYVVYDEFSKFLESNITAASVSDTKMLQDFAEKCNRSSENELHLLLISHKEISNYIDQLPKAKVDGWRGVSERFRHIHLNNNFAQTYEIISTVIIKDRDKWEDFQDNNKARFDQLMSRYAEHAIFSDTDQKELETTIYECYPLHPVSTFILPRLSERVAQNERTLFTFLSADGTSTLPAFLRGLKDKDFRVITPDLIFDYFDPVLQKEPFAGELHKNYVLTKTILGQIEDQILESKIVKTISLIYLLGQFDKLKPIKEEIVGIYSMEYKPAEIEAAIEHLIKDEYVIYLKRSNDYLKLKQTSGVDVEQKISDTIAALTPSFSLKSALNALNIDNYLYPSKYNDEKEMIRYFEFEFIEEQELEGDIDWVKKAGDINADGVVYAIICENPESIKEIKNKILKTSRGCDRFIFIMPKKSTAIRKILQEFEAASALRDKAKEDTVLFEEYEVIYEDLRDVISEFISGYTHPEDYKSVYIYNGEEKSILRKAALTGLASDICFSVIGSYEKSFDSKSNTKIQEYTAKIDKCNARLAEIDAALEELDTQKAAAETRKSEKVIELKQYSEGKKLQKEKEDLQKQIENTTRMRATVYKTMCKDFNASMSPFFSISLIKRALEVLSRHDYSGKDIPFIRDKTIEYLLKQKVCLCGTHLDEGSVPYEKVKSLLDVIPPKSLSTYVTDFKKESKRRAGALQDLVEQMQENLATASQQSDDIMDKTDELHKIEAKLSGKDVSEKVRAINNEIQICVKTINKCNNDRDKLNIERGGLEKERERADTERQNLTLLDEKNRKTQMYLTYARKIYEELENVYRTSEEEIRNRLQDTINDIFKQIYEGGLSLTIDSKYHITVQANDYEGDVETSTAQSISVIFAFITGIIKMARENRNASDDDAKLLSSEPYPLVMDAPLSAFDKRRIKTVCEALPETAEQVIIFIKDTDGELAEDYMGNRIGSRHQFDKKNEFETNLV